MRIPLHSILISLSITNSITFSVQDMLMYGYAIINLLQEQLLVEQLRRSRLLVNDTTCNFLNTPFIIYLTILLTQQIYLQEQKAVMENEALRKQVRNKTKSKLYKCEINFSICFLVQL